MASLLVPLALIIAIVSVVIAMLQWAGKLQVHLGWAGAAVLAMFAYSLMLVTGSAWIPLDWLKADLSWNWGGKIAANWLWIGLLALTLRLKPGFRPAMAGFTLRQQAGSIRPAILVLVGVVLLSLALKLAMASQPFDLETLLFQATMPGLDEEPMFRGILLYFATLAIITRPIRLAGASLSVGGLALVLIFGLVHGVFFDGNEWHFAPASILFTGLYGLVFLWLRERTGSLIFPILAHNLANVVLTTPWPF